MPHDLVGAVADKDVLSPMLWEDNGYSHTSDGDSNNIIDFNITIGMGVEILGIRHIAFVRGDANDAIMSLFAEATLDLGATLVGGGAATATTFENTQAIWQDAWSSVGLFLTSGTSTLSTGPYGSDWWPRQPIILAQNLNIVTSFVETISGTIMGNIRVWFRYVSLSDIAIVRLLARGRFR